ncbi:hypothetical protein [Anaeromassilibacillus senegalensis]|uniref:hypothetical protein n=1 Tax=Anaeromassilibacillus senegalensis TaxID=1673717 RepID=UPI00068364BA|nr:hypothetical protein [Anaeromassilibacillus senegalensis]
MPGQKKSALSAATVQSAKSNIIYIDFTQKTNKSQDLFCTEHAKYPQFCMGKVIQLDEKRKTARKHTTDLKNNIHGTFADNSERGKAEPITREKAQKLFLEVMETREHYIKCPENSMKIMRDRITQMRGNR